MPTLRRKLQQTGMAQTFLIQSCLNINNYMDKDSSALEDKMLRNQQRFDHLARKSHILSKMEARSDPSELELVRRINRTRQQQAQSQIIQQGQVFTRQFWLATISRNYDIAAWLLMDISSNFFLYFFDTIKVRTQARNRFRDISYFDRNQINKLPLFQGLHYRLTYVALSDLVRNFTTKVRHTLQTDPHSPFQSLSLLSKLTIHGLATEAIITTMFLPIEIRKCLVQMGSFHVPFSHYVNSYARLWLPALIRDSTFFLTHSILFNLLCYQDLFLAALFKPQEFVPPIVRVQGEREKRFTCMLISLSICCLITNPFDVVVSKMATQREDAYSNPFTALRKIKSEEGLSKLMTSAISARIGFYFLKGFLFFTYQDQVMQMFADAFEY